MSLSKYLHDHQAKDKPITHTRIPDGPLGIYGGSYNVDDEELGVFFQVYHNHVFGPNPMPEYLTEKQRLVGPLVVDLDFRYLEATRAYTPAHVELFVNMMMEELQKMVVEIPFDVEVYIMEKTKVNDTNPKVIKDGVHLLFGVNMDKTMKDMLRVRMLSRMDQIWDDLKERLTNDWNSVIDRGVMVSTTGWTLYGSRKPGHEAYKVTLAYKVSIQDGAPLISRYPVPVVTSTFLPKLSVRYQEYPLLDNLRPVFHEEYDNLRSNSSRPSKTPRTVDLTGSAEAPMDLTTAEKVDQALARLFENLGVSRTSVKQAHEFAMVLPEKYWGANSYEKWIRVGFALKNADDQLFPSWVKFSSKSANFSYADVPSMLAKWNGWLTKDNGGLTTRSLAYWAFNDNHTGYLEVVKSSVNSVVDEIIKSQTPTEYDLAVLLHTIYKDKFVCVSIKNKLWYAFEDHHWVETDTGSNLRLELSQSVWKLFLQKLVAAMANVPPDKESAELHKKRVNKISSIMVDLKNHTKKMNIMKEAADLFYVPNFMTKLDSKPFLLGCTNGVVDFEHPDLFRPGRPDDFIYRTTRIEYVPITTPEQEDIKAEVNQFLDQLFPVPELRKYMWDHMASLLIGKNHNQTFNIYTGVGSNGKSKFVELLGLVLGDYKATIPVSLITQKRQGIGSSCSEVAQLMGVRYAVMQEPSKGDRINEGVMKELTGDDPLQARALYKDSMTFEVFFKLVMCANDLPNITSTDQGTWRRIRVCHFMSVFNNSPNPNDPTNPHQFQVDKKLAEKFENWRPVLLAMMVEHANVTRGIVEDCAFVTNKSDEYRHTQDMFSEFIRTNIRVDARGSVKKTDLTETFTSWWGANESNASRPPLKDLYAYMGRKNIGVKVSPPGLGVYWNGISIIQESANAMEAFE